MKEKKKEKETKKKKPKHANTAKKQNKKTTSKKAKAKKKARKTKKPSRYIIINKKDKLTKEGEALFKSLKKLNTQIKKYEDIKVKGLDDKDEDFKYYKLFCLVVKKREDVGDLIKLRNKIVNVLRDENKTNGAKTKIPRKLYNTFCETVNGYKTKKTKIKSDKEIKKYIKDNPTLFKKYGPFFKAVAQQMLDKKEKEKLEKELAKYKTPKTANKEERAKLKAKREPIQKQLNELKHNGNLMYILTTIMGRGNDPTDVKELAKCTRGKTLKQGLEYVGQTDEAQETERKKYNNELTIATDKLRKTGEKKNWTVKQLNVEIKKVEKQLAKKYPNTEMGKDPRLSEIENKMIEHQQQVTDSTTGKKKQKKNFFQKRVDEWILWKEKPEIKE